MYLKNPMEIENKSFKIISDNIGKHSFNEEELKVVMRTIHTTGDYDYKNIVVFKNDPIKKAISIISCGCRIVTDTMMAYSGINKKALENRL